MLRCAGSCTGYVRTVVTIAGYGRWASPLAPDDVARREGLTLRAVLRRRCPLLARVAPRRVGPRGPGTGRRHGPTDHSPEGVSIRSRVNEYGGGAVCLVPRRSVGAFAYVDQTEQRVWFCDGPASADSSPPAVPWALTVAPPDGEVHNHGGLDATPDGDWILAVREVHRPGLQRPVRSVVASSTRGAEPTESTLLAGHDFFGAPRVDGAAPGWRSWSGITPTCRGMRRRSRSFPSPGRRARLRTPRPWRRVRRGDVAGGPEEAVGQPAWRGDGTLRFVSDRTGWWQPYVHAGRAGADAADRALTDRAAEFHGPDWVLGQTTMADLADGTLVVRMTASGRDSLLALATGGGLDPVPDGVALDQPCSVSISALCAHGEGLALIGSTPATLRTCGCGRRTQRRGRCVRLPARASRRRRRRRRGAVLADGAVRSHRARDALPAHVAGHRRAGRPEAAPGDLVSWGTHVLLPGRVRPDTPVLHQPRLRRGVRGLRGQLGVRAALPLLAVGPVGRRRCRGLSRCGVAPRGTRRHRRPAHGRSRWECRGHDSAQRALLRGRDSGPVFRGTG